MNRIEALAYIDGKLGAQFELIGRLRDDSAEGWKPVLDQAFRRYIVMYGKSTTVTTTTVAADEEECFEYLLDALAYGYILPFVAGDSADISVDAPLTSIKYSQQYRQFQTQEAAAWEKAGACGYGKSTSEFGGFKVNFDYNEPELAASGEY